jgi:hypothetical protein
MDIRLPDGTILRGVPDGTTKEQIREKLAAKGYDVTKLDAPKPPQQDPMVPADQRQSGYRATLGLPEKGPTAAGVADAVTRGVAPYAIAAGAGAGAGSVVPGVGTLTGAGAGVTALALTDAASGIWNNTAVPFLGAPQMTGGSDAIRNMTDATGVTKPLADDPNARVAYQMANMGASSMGFGNVVNMGGQLLSRAPGPIGAIGNFFAKPITATSATAGGVRGRSQACYARPVRRCAQGPRKCSVRRSPRAGRRVDACSYRRHYFPRRAASRRRHQQHALDAYRGGVWACPRCAAQDERRGGG